MTTDVSTATTTQQNIGLYAPFGAQAVRKTVPIATPASSNEGNSAVSTPALQSQTPSVNGHLKDSGQPNQFRMDPHSADKLIQEINPATGEVIAEYSADEFPALAKSLGIGRVGSVIDSLA